MKILHFPSNIAGNAFGLAQGERMLGLDAKALSIGASSYGFPSDWVIPAKKTRFSQLIHRVKAFIEVRRAYDVYHFNFGATLLHDLNAGLILADLPFYKKEAVKVVTYQGCDARQKYPTIARIKSNGSKQAACLYEGCYGGMCDSGRRDQQRQRAIEKMMRYCQHAFALNPDLLYFLPAETSSFLPYTVPNFDDILPKSGPFFLNDTIKIVHAPTQRITKGSAFIIEAMAALQDTFPNRIDFQLVENKPYEEALALYRSADLVIDQVLIGWYGGLAVEVMKMGIPVAAFINEADLHFIPTDFARELPIIRVQVDTLVDDLTKVMMHRERLIEAGAASKRFVERWHHPKAVAVLTKQVYEQCAGL